MVHVLSGLHKLRVCTPIYLIRLFGTGSNAPCDADMPSEWNFLQKEEQRGCVG